MQPEGLRTGLRQRVPCRSAVCAPLLRPLRSQLVRSAPPWIARSSNGAGDGAGMAQPASAREPGPLPVAGGGAGDAAAEVPASSGTAAADGAPSVSLGAAAASLAGPAETPSASASTTPQPSANQSSATASAAPAAAAAGSTSSSLPPFLQQLLSWLASVWSAVQQFPMWVQMQHIRRLREACEEDPKDADKHAAYLAELMRSNPQEVVARVESKQFGVNAAVVAEYLRALVATGKVTELVKADSAAAAEAAAAAAAASSAVTGAPGSPGDVQSPRTLTELLRDLQVQLATASSDPTAAADGSGGLAMTLEAPGSSLRRPLHVVVGGLPALQVAQSMGGSAQPSGNKTPLLLRPLALLWRLASTAVLLLVLALAFIAGSQAIRRVQASGGAFVSPAAVSGAGPPVSAAGGGSGAGASAASSSGGGGPSVEPKEYKKDELPEKSIRTFKDVKGCDEAKEELREVVEFLKNPTKFTRLGAKLPKGVLLSGPPGTGKTLLAKAVAGEAGVPFFYRAGSEFEELYVGVGSRRMRALFSAAKKRSPCIVFIDEIDAIGGNRKAWENHTRKTLNQLLVEMDGFESTDGIIVMAATNLPESLDPALKRPGRFDRQVAVPLPDIKGRRDILEYYLSDKPLAGDVDRELLARQTQGFSGADLSNLINEGAILAAKEGADNINQRMLDWAYDKILMGVERKSVKRTLEARRRTAFHEAGHALVALATPGASPIHKATIVPRGHALGMVTQVGREDEFSINRQQMLARIRVCMGGTVAEELVFGTDQVSSGATDDLRQATSMARHMVTECGMSPAIGPVYVAAHDERHGGSSVSEATRQRVDSEVTNMLAEAKEAVRGLLTERMQDLRTLAEALLDRETLTREEINSLLQHGEQQTPPPQTPGGGSGGSGGSGGDRQHREGEEQPPQLEGDPAPAAAVASLPQAPVEAAALATPGLAASATPSHESSAATASGGSGAESQKASSSSSCSDSRGSLGVGSARSHAAASSSSSSVAPARTPTGGSRAGGGLEAAPDVEAQQASIRGAAPAAAAEDELPSTSARYLPASPAPPATRRGAMGRSLQAGRWEHHLRADGGEDGYDERDDDSDGEMQASLASREKLMLLVREPRGLPAESDGDGDGWRRG